MGVIKILLAITLFNVNFLSGSADRAVANPLDKLGEEVTSRIWKFLGQRSSCLYNGELFNDGEIVIVAEEACAKIVCKVVWGSNSQLSTSNLKLQPLENCHCQLLTKRTFGLPFLSGFRKTLKKTLKKLSETVDHTENSNWNTEEGCYFNGHLILDGGIADSVPLGCAQLRCEKAVLDGPAELTIFVNQECTCSVVAVASTTTTTQIPLAGMTTDNRTTAMTPDASPTETTPDGYPIGIMNDGSPVGILNRGSPIRIINDDSPFEMVNLRSAFGIRNDDVTTGMTDDVTDRMPNGMMPSNNTTVMTTDGTATGMMTDGTSVERTSGVTTGMRGGVTTGMAGGVTTGMAGGVTTGMTGGVTTGMTGGVTTGMTGGVTTGMTGGVITGMTGGVTTGMITNGTTTGMTGGITSGMTGGITSGMTGGITTGMTGGVTTGMTGGVTTGMTGGVTTGMAGGVTTGMTGGVITGMITNGTTTGMTGGITSGMTGGITSGMTGEITSGMTGEITSGMTGEITSGMTGEITSGMTGEITTGMAADMTTGVTTGMTDGVTTGMTDGVITGMTGGVTTGMIGGVTTQPTTDFTSPFPASTDAATTPSPCSRYEQFAQRHTMCLPPNPRCYTRESSISAAEKDYIVKTHNFIRAFMATGVAEAGSNGTLPPSSNMKELKWNEELADIALAWARLCPSDHDCYNCRVPVTTPYSVTGQNIYKSYGIQGIVEHDVTSLLGNIPLWENAIGAWSNESVHVDVGVVRAFLPRVEGKVVGHFSQLVWAKTGEIGCASTTYGPCTDRSGTGLYAQCHVFVCNYGPAGNYVGEPIYAEGVPASMCDNGRSALVAGLCNP